MKKFILAALVLTPALASAQQELGGVRDLLEAFKGLVELAMPIVVGLALLGFFWGLVKFIFAQGNDDTKKEGKRFMIWSVIALFVMVSVWGLVAFVRENLGISNTNTPGSLPKVPGL